MRTYKLSHITDLTQLTEDDVALFAAELPTLVATLKMAQARAEGALLSDVFPHITYAPEIGDKVVLRTENTNATLDGGDVRSAHAVDVVADAAISRARRRP